ncbi:MAG TPA: DUF1501 domain-containing protein [Pirellulales bacterium]|nr:DUF1501 domain-containing protein [Pirellulales bacterium]
MADGKPFLSRREWLRIGLGSIGGLSLPDLFRRRAMANTVGGEPTAVILVWLPGGASHLETYDPKPLAGSDYRGPFAPIATRAPGLQLSELLPRHAAVADKFTLLRSMVHTGFCHQQGTQQLFTGHPVRELKQKPDHPDLFSVASFLRRDPGRKLPNYVGVPGANYLGAAYLGSAYEPFVVNGDLSAPAFHVPNIGLTDAQTVGRMSDRVALRRRFDRLRRDIDGLGEMNAFDACESQALQLLTGEEAREAFDLTREDPRVRERYGLNSWGQQCLLARRLVEAGVDLVTTQFGGPLCGRVGNWDDHAVNHNVFEGMRLRTPPFDQAVAALIGDLYERGLDRRVLLIVAGEFGRTPKISYVASSGEGAASATAGVVQPGRDHWPSATSILFSGGRIATGRVVGKTDARGEQVTDRRVGVGDFLATVYQHLGIDAGSVAIRNFDGRPIPILQEGQPIRELSAAG